MEGAVTGMTGVMTVVTELFGGMTDVVAEMMKSGNELMLIPIGLLVGGGIIGLASRLIGR